MSENQELQIDFRALNIRQGQLKAKLTRFDNFLSSVIDTEAVGQLEIRLEAIQNVIRNLIIPKIKSTSVMRK